RKARGAAQGGDEKEGRGGQRAKIRQATPQGSIEVSRAPARAAASVSGWRILQVGRRPPAASASASPPQTPAVALSASQRRFAIARRPTGLAAHAATRDRSRPSGLA